ncbi:MAG: DUF481 domain-containing protein [Paludibacteraceae bacterium]|nr:DUF481 domain-containing protein [Paludibacteraceae bacterium]
MITNFKPKTLLKGFLLLVLLFCVSSVRAEDGKKMKYVLTAGGKLNDGSVVDFDARATGEIDRNDSVFAFNINGRYYYSEKKHRETNRGYDGAVTMDFFQYNTWSPFFLFTYLSNKRKGYDIKLNSFVGGKYRIYTKPDVTDLSVSLAWGYENVEYSTKTELDSHDFRFSLRPKIKQKIGKVARLTNSFFYQPCCDDFSNYYLRNVTKLDFKITRVFHLGVDFEYDYRSMLPGPIYKHNDVYMDFNMKLVL